MVGVSPRGKRPQCAGGGRSAGGRFCVTQSAVCVTLSAGSRVLCVTQSAVCVTQSAGGGGGGRGQGFLCNAVCSLVAPYPVELRGPNAKALIYLVRKQTPPKGLDFLNLFLGKLSLGNHGCMSTSPIYLDGNLVGRWGLRNPGKQWRPGKAFSFAILMLNRGTGMWSRARQSSTYSQFRLVWCMDILRRLPHAGRALRWP